MDLCAVTVKLTAILSRKSFISLFFYFFPSYLIYLRFSTLSLSTSLIFLSPLSLSPFHFITSVSSLSLFLFPNQDGRISCYALSESSSPQPSTQLPLCSSGMGRVCHPGRGQPGVISLSSAAVSSHTTRGRCSGTLVSKRGSGPGSPLAPKMTYDHQGPGL